MQQFLDAFVSLWNDSGLARLFNFEGGGWKNLIMIGVACVLLFLAIKKQFELRDYRFYGDDLVHPSRQAIEYIAERFFDAALSPRAKEQMQQVRAIVRAVGHRPRNPQSEAYRTFCRQQLAAMDTLPEIDFSKERAEMERTLHL